MKTANDLRKLLQEIDHRSYPSYKSLKGIYDFEQYRLAIDHVQGDPFAAPSHVSVYVAKKDARFPQEYMADKKSCIALSDFILRTFLQLSAEYSFKAKGSGKSGLLSVSHPGQEVLERSACQVLEKDLVLRFHIGFPANGRSINSGELAKILFDFLPRMVDRSLYYRNLKQEALKKHIGLYLDQEFIREELAKRGLLAFVADGAILPRESGISDRPLKGAIPFRSPKTMEMELELPFGGKKKGMGIPKGICLIVGGGYHGKSTLLKALERGVYNHIPGDGREYVITEHTAMKVRAEDGRFIKDVDISPFIRELPNGNDTKCFSTADASGSTSQAAGIIEAMEAGCHTLLLDEDSSATNFMLRDDFMRAVVSPEKEPIIPFLQRARELYTEAGLSTILVAGSSGDFFHIADHVLQMDEYKVLDITDKVKAMLSDFPMSQSAIEALTLPDARRIMTKDPNNIQKRRDYRSGRATGEFENLKLRNNGTDGFSLGNQTIELRYVEQLVDREQSETLGRILKYAVEHVIDGKRSLPEVIGVITKQIASQGFAAVTDGGYVPAGLSEVRTQEIYACFNRYRR